MISPRTSVNVAGGCGTSVDRILTMAFDDATMDDIRETLATHEIVLGDE